MTECGFAAVVERRQENTFLLRDDLPWQGCRHLFFSIGTKTKERKKAKKKRKEPKEKKRFIIYIFCFKKIYIYIYIYSCLCGDTCPWTCPYPRCLCRFYRRLTCPSTCGFTCPYPCPYLCGKCRFYRSLTCPSTWGFAWGCFWDAISIYY